MRVRVTLPSKEGKRLKDKILALISTVEDDDWSDNWELVSLVSLALAPVAVSLTLRYFASQTALIEPGSFRLIDEILQNELKGKGADRGKIETLSFAAVVGEERID